MEGPARPSGGAPSAGSAAVPRVAVVVPCFNDGATLADTLRSLEAQEACELVVVDDGSYDPETLAVLDRLSQSGVRVLRQANSGPGAARMAGVRATTAPYVFPLDADDLLAPGALKALADALDTDGNQAAWGDIETFGTARVYRKGPLRLDPWLITYVNELTGAATLIRREALLAAGGWPAGEAYENWDLWMSFAERGWGGVYVPRLVLRYRCHGPRRLARVTDGYARSIAAMRRRHRTLFERRQPNWRRSSAPWRLKLLLPVIEHVPWVGEAFKHRVGNLLAHPTYALKTRFDRLRPGTTRPASGR